MNAMNDVSHKNESSKQMQLMMERHDLEIKTHKN